MQDQLAVLRTVFDWVCNEPAGPASSSASGGGPDKKARLLQAGFIVQFLYEFDVVESQVRTKQQATSGLG
jgi:hypothetical protein